MTSIKRAGHSNILIGGIAALAIAGMTMAGVLGLLSNHRQDKTDAKLNTAQTKLHTQQQILHRQQQILHRQQQNLRDQQATERRDQHCIERYENRAHRRDEIVGRYAVVRSRDLGRVQLFQARHPLAHGRYLIRLRLQYVAADRAYLRAERRYPVPEFRCADLPPVKVPRVKVRHVPLPPPSSNPATAPAPAPSTVTTTAPGPTTTTTAPPGKGHRRRHRHRHHHP